MRTELVKRVERNTKGRDLIVGDVQGCFSRLSSALRAVGFDPEEGDRVFSVGNLVGQPAESLAAMQFISEDFAYAVRGDKEMIVKRFVDGDISMLDYAYYGGHWLVELDQEQREEVAQALMALPVAIELDTAAGLVGIVAAECPFLGWQEFTAALEEQDTGRTERKLMLSMVMRSRQRIDESTTTKIAGVRAVVVGHASVPTMLTLGNTIYIDTMGWRGGQFTILDAATLRPAARVRRN